jgi:hypothetical protein
MSFFIKYKTNVSIPFCIKYKTNVGIPFLFLLKNLLKTYKEIFLIYIMKNINRATIKVKLKDILKDDKDYTCLFKAINNSNKLINIGYLFIRSFILYIIENNNTCKFKIEEPTIDIAFIGRAFSVISTDADSKKKGRPFKEDTMLDILKDFYNKFKINTDISVLNVNNISYILGQEYKQILISITNNIKYHYDKHVWKYIKASFNDEYLILKEANVKDTVRNFTLELLKIKNDLLNNTNTALKKYNKWIKINKKLIIPISYTSESFDTDCKKNTFSYIKCMHLINNFIQTKELKSLQMFPLRTSISDNYIKINTSALIDIFYDTDKLEKFSIAGDNILQNTLWSECFNIKDSKDKYTLKRKGFSFNYEIMTDGYAVSLNFINNNKIKNKENRKKNNKKARNKTNKIKKESTDDEYNLYLDNKKEDKLNKEQENNIIIQNKIKQKQQEFKKLPEKEQTEIKLKMNDKCEFPYIDKLLINKNNRDIFKKDMEDGNIVVCDPGKRSLLYLMACNNNIHNKITDNKNNNFGPTEWNDHKIMNYTNNTRINFIKTKYYAKLIEKWKKDTSSDKFKFVSSMNQIIYKRIKNKRKYKNERLFLKKEIDLNSKSLKEIETELSKFNSKSCSYDEFNKYIVKKQEYMQKTECQYDTTYLQKLRWFTYINKRRHENKLLDNIENEFGKNIKIIIGDWSSNTQLKNSMPTPNISIKRKLKERFKVYLIDEYLTSKMHYKHKVRCDNIEINVKPKPTVENTNPKEYKKKLHSVLSYKIEKEVMGCKKLYEMGCINRDKNSVLNMETIVKELIKTGKRPEIFSRKKTIDQSRKGVT